MGMSFFVLFLSKLSLQDSKTLEVNLEA